MAYASVCSLEPFHDRPVVGVMNYCLDQVPVEGEINGSLSGFSVEGAVFREDHLQITLLDITTHELTHILGQNADLFPYFRDEDGNPRTERDSEDKSIPILSQQTCIDGATEIGSLPSSTTIETIKTTDGRFEQYLVTPRVQTIARNHFQCQSLIGSRLNNEDKCIGTHWHERHYLGHLQSPVITNSIENSLSLLTLALLEDSGWYQVDYRGGSHPSFGLGAGCAFVEEDCIDGATDTVADWVIGEFCDTPLGFSQPGNAFCDPTSISWTICDLSRFQKPTRSYFSDEILGPFLFPMADECPIPLLGMGLDCRRDDPYNAFYPGESVGGTSRCINARYAGSDGGQIHRPACMSVNCNDELGVVILGDSQHICSSDGEIIPIIGQNGGFLVCPRLASLCPHMFVCEGGCYGRGDCVQIVDDTGRSRPTCQCFDPNNTDRLCRPEIFQLQSTPKPSTIAPGSEIRVPVQYPNNNPASSPLSPILPPNPSSIQPSALSRPSSSALQLRCYTSAFVVRTLQLVALLVLS